MMNIAAHTNLISHKTSIKIKGNWAVNLSFKQFSNLSSVKISLGKYEIYFSLWLSSFDFSILVLCKLKVKCSRTYDLSASKYDDLRWWFRCLLFLLLKFVILAIIS